MERHTQLVLFWLLLVAACIAGFWSLGNAWTKGEFTRSTRSGLKVWKVIRRDEDPTRAKERYFSPRNAQFEWDYKDQPPEFWGQFATTAAKGEHVRVQPLLDWTEVDIWCYIQRENIPVPKMYFAKNGQRYRSLGCSPITKPIKSNADTIDAIIAELETTRTSERAGRAQDHHERNAMQKLRAKGFL